ncbi:AAA family ATPase [Pseudoflavitalea rhizosphaerae]|uniref:AAA family ATPase n=1 Tax=Pseudoflavitalea rhizosphaerae TaxID=1884793 RepID=UPI000F8EE7D8|nr:AAA family ATPase [Pseudoflavitalea rhizosphaerae]
MKKIVIIGPESTGKSTLCQQLADHFGTDWVPEYAREYLLEHGTEYHYDDLLTIAKGQVVLEDKHAAAFPQNYAPNSPLFIDTDLYVMKVWCEFVYQKCHQWILDNIVTRRYDLYLLCNIDLPWVKDELREYPDLLSRQQLYHIYKDIMINQAVPWVDISGDYEERFRRAQKAVKNLLTS